MHPASHYPRFWKSTRTILILFAIAKILSAAGVERILNEPDPLLGFSNRELLLLTGIVELSVAALLVKARTDRSRGWLLLWTSLMFLNYRFFKYLLHPGDVCGCMGSIGRWLGLPSWAQSGIPLVVSFYFLGAALGILVLDRCNSVFLRNGEVPTSGTRGN
jgi:hypothetical protein